MRSVWEVTGGKNNMTATAQERQIKVVLVEENMAGRETTHTETS